jgi:hypothetical protein
MMRRSSSIRWSVNVAALVLLVAGVASAQSYKVEKIAAAPPQELAPAVREALAGEALRVVGPQGTLCEFWLRKVMSAQANPSQEVDVTLGQLAEGTLLGAVRFPADVKDYRSQRIKAGVYTLRYALIPTDGNHYGVAPQRDFLLASPASADQSADTVSRDATLALSRKATGTNHASVWSLAALDSPPASLPAMAHQEDGDMWLLEFRAPVQSGSSVSRAAMALVVVGHAPEA